jgi:hypothetical protein
MDGHGEAMSQTGECCKHAKGTLTDPLYWGESAKGDLPPLT